MEKYNYLLNPSTESLTNYPVMDTRGAIINAARAGDLEAVKMGVFLGIDSDIEDNYAVINAAAKGHLEVVKYLCSLPNFDPNIHEEAPLRMLEMLTPVMAAMAFDKTEVVKYLCTLPGVDPFAYNYFAIELIVQNGCYDTMKFICTLPDVDLDAIMKRAYHRVSFRDIVTGFIVKEKITKSRIRRLIELRGLPKDLVDSYF